MAELTYLNLIKKAIGDFDSIYGALKGKKVLSGNAVLTDAARDNGTISTASYADLITEQLFRIDGLTSAQLGAETVIANKTGSSVTSGTPVLARQTGEGANDLVYNVTLPIAAAGYYDTTSSVANTITTQKLTIDSTFLNFDAVNDIYSYAVPSTGSLISKVDVKKGLIGVNWTGAYSDNLAYNSTLEVKAADLSNDKYTLEAPADAATNWVAVEFKAALTKTGKVTVAPSKAEGSKDGYIKTSDVSLGKFEEEFENAAVAADTLGGAKLFIKKGSIEVADSSLAGVETSFVSTDVEFGTDATDGYLITASVAQAGKETIELKGTVTEGYVKQGTGDTVDLGSISLETGTKYIKKGTVNDPTVTATLGDITSTDGILTTDTTGAYELTVTASASASGTVTNGYIKGANGSVAYSGSDTDSTTAYIKHGSFAINPSASVSINSAIGSVVTDAVNTETHYAITATPVIANTTKSGLTAGFIKAADITDGTKTETASVLAIAKGSASITNGLSVSFKNVDTDIPNEDMASVDIFLGAAPANRDYYVVTSSASVGSFTAGYFADSGNIATTSVATKYLAKADLQLFEDEDGNLSVNVLQGGYLPSGLLTVDTTETKLSPAAVNLVINSSASDEGIFSASGVTGDYKLVVSKGAVTSGLMSETTGSVTGAFYVAHGNVKVGTSVGTLTQSAVTKNAETSKYNLTVSGEATTSITSVTAGYVKQADVELSGTPATISKVVVLDAGSVEYKSNTITVTADIDSKVATTTDASLGYAITPKLNGGNVVVDTAVEGYIAADDEFTINLSNDKIAEANRAPLYILKGTGVELNKPAAGVTNTVKATANFDTTQSGAYTVTVEGTATITGKVNAGYYEEATINETGFAVKGTSLSVAHGSVTNTISATSSLSSDDVIFIGENENLDNKPYVTVSADVASITHNRTVVEGYVKDGDVNTVTSISNPTASSISKKIAAVNIATTHARTEGSSELVYCVKVGSDEDVTLDAAAANTKVIIDETKQKYSKYATCIELNDHAMGASVIDAIADLELRLAGNLARS